MHTAPWPHCPNKNVFSNRLNWPCDSPHSLRSGGRLFQTCSPAAAKVLSPKLLRVRLTTSVRVSAERSCLARASATSWQSSARLPGALRRRCRTRTGRRQSQSWTRRAAAQEASAAGGAQARYDHIAWCLPRAWRQRSELTAGSS